MANDVKVIPKQFISQPVNLGHTDAYSRVQEGLSQIAEYASGEAGKIFEEKARKKGEAKALANVGKPQKSAMGLTHATRVENEAYQSATSKLLTVKLNSLLAQNSQYVSDRLQLLGPKAIEKLNDLNDATMKGFESQIPDEIKSDIQYQFVLGKEKTMVNMMAQVSEMNNKLAAESFNTTFTSDLKNLQEKIYAGDLIGEEQAYKQAKKTIADYKALGKLSPSDEMSHDYKLNYTVSDTKAVAGLLQARAHGPKAEAEYIHAAATEQPTGISREQWISGQNAIAKEMKRLSKLEGEYYAGLKADINYGIETGKISKESDLEPYYNKLPASVITDFMTKIAKGNAKDDATQIEIDEYNRLSQDNPGAATLTPDNIKDAAFQQKLEPILAAKRLKTGDPNAKLTLREMIPTLREEPGPIRWFSAQIEYGIKSNIPEVSQDAILAYKDANISTGSLSRARGLEVDATSDRIAFMSLSLAQNLGQTLGSAIETAQKSILLINDDQRLANIDAYKAQFETGNKGVKNFNAAFTNASGVSPLNNSFAAKVYKDLLRANSAEMPNPLDAQNLTDMQFKKAFSKSEYNRDPSQVMQYSPELVVPKAEMGRWLKNQEILALYSVVKRLESAPIAKANRVKNEKRANEIASQLSSQSLTDEQSAKLNAELEGLNEQLLLANYDGPNVKWTMGKLKDSYTEAELMNDDLFVEAMRSKVSQRPGGISEQAALGLTVAELFGNRNRKSRRPTVSFDGIERAMYLRSSPETVNNADGEASYGWISDNGIGAPTALDDPLNIKTENPEYKGKAVFKVRPLEKFLPKISKTMNDKSFAELTEKEQNALFSKENPLSVYDYTFSRQAAIEDRYNKKVAFKKRYEEEAKARAAAEKGAPPK